MVARSGPWMPMGQRLQAWRVHTPAPVRGGRREPSPREAGLQVKVAAGSLERLRSLAAEAEPLGLQVLWDWGAAPGAGQEGERASSGRLQLRPPGWWSDDAADGHGLVLAGGEEALGALAGAWRAVDPEAATALDQALQAGRRPPASFRAGQDRYSLQRLPYLFGILNVTRDSFYARARHFGIDAALRRGEEILQEGGDWIEVGGESARGGSPLPPEEEVERVVPVVEALRARIPLPVAVDTFKPQVARAAVEAGATLINDISGGADPMMFQVARESGAALVLMHLTARPKEEYQDPGYPSTLDAVRWFLGERLALAREAGVEEERLLVDPGLNFGKHPRRDLEIMRALPAFLALGRPIYLATSRKDYLRDLLGLPPEELLEATQAAVAYAIFQGVTLFRVHDVGAMARVRATAWALSQAYSDRADGTP